MTAMIEVKIRMDMPLPMPRSVMSSPIHMTHAVPAVMVSTMTSICPAVVSGTMFSEHPWNRLPGVRASARIDADCSTAKPMVRYRVYWVIVAWPAWPSLRSISSRGMTTASNCKMIDAVMYGMMPSAKIDNCSNAPPLKRLISEYRLFSCTTLMHR